MDDRDFLDAIIAAPEDDIPRLVYADWLDERGCGERAEFIRVQCELAQKAKYDPSRLPLLKREQMLLTKHGDGWAKSVAAITRDYEFHRGFVDTVVIGGRKFLTHGDKVFELAPVRNVKITRLGSSNVTTADLARSNLLPRIRGLTLQGSLGSKELVTLIKAPGLKVLTAFSLELYFHAETTNAILAGCFPHLETLNLNVDDSLLTTAHVEKLAKARWASKLKYLNLKDHIINVGGVQAIAASKQMKNLTRLNLHHCGVGLGGVQALAESPNMANLTSLDLRRNRLTDSSARALASSTELPGLTELFLGMNEIGPEGARALANWPGLARLRFLHLYANPLGDDGVCALAESPHIANLCYLDVTGTDIGDRGARALAKSPFLEHVHVGSFKGDEKEAILDPKDAR